MQISEYLPFGDSQAFTSGSVYGKEGAAAGTIESALPIVDGDERICKVRAAQHCLDIHTPAACEGISLYPTTTTRVPSCLSNPDAADLSSR